MRRGFFAAALVTGALVIGGTAAALEVPEKYTVTIEFTPTSGSETVKRVIKCHRATSCRETVKLPIDGKEESLWFASYVRGPELLEVNLEKPLTEPQIIDKMSRNKPYWNGLSWEEEVVKTRMTRTGKMIVEGRPGASLKVPEVKRVTSPKGRIRFTVSAG